MTTKASRKFSTPMGIFTYTNLQLPYYTFGIQQVKLSDQQNVMIASPEKALFDKIITTAGVALRSQKDAFTYLMAVLRIDEDNLKNFNTRKMLEWLPDAPKKESLAMIVSVIEKL